MELFTKVICSLKSLQVQILRQFCLALMHLSSKVTLTVNFALFQFVYNFPVRVPVLIYI